MKTTSTAFLVSLMAATALTGSVAAANKDLKFAADGSLTIYVQAEAPTDPAQRANWLPAPGGDFSLYVRAYWPKAEIVEGSWTPPAVRRVDGATIGVRQ